MFFFSPTSVGSRADRQGASMVSGGQCLVNWEVLS